MLKDDISYLRDELGTKRFAVIFYKHIRRQITMSNNLNIRDGRDDVNTVKVS